MKYVVFTLAVLGVPPLILLFARSRLAMRFWLWGSLLSMFMWHRTAINFFSNEFYRGSTRGMEVSLAYLFAFSVLMALALRGRLVKLLPEIGFVLYLIYFLLCLPGASVAANGLFFWFEVWKMLMMYLMYLATYSYLKATGDIQTVLKAFALFVFVNFLSVIRDQYLRGIYQPHGCFPHRNSMAMGMQLLGPVFFALYLKMGVRSRLGKLYTAAFLCAALSTLRSFSRMAIALMPVAYALPAFVFLTRRGLKRWCLRVLPLAGMAALGLAFLMPRIVERFVHAPASSGLTRIELARCAWEMIKDEPLRGVGMNNWGIKINAPYDYAERAGRTVNRGEDWFDGVVETVYLLVGAECGIPALVAMIAWFLWYLVSCIRLTVRLRETWYAVIPAGLLGGLAASYLQSAFEWVLRQQLNLMLLVMSFAMLAWLNTNWRELKAAGVRLPKEVPCA